MGTLGMSYRGVLRLVFRIALLLTVVCTMLVWLAQMLATALPPGPTLALIPNVLEPEVILLDTTRRLTASATPPATTFAALSPDGAAIAYAVQNPKAQTTAVTITNLSSSPHLTVTLPADAVPLVWSPDGRWLAYSADGAHGGLKLLDLGSVHRGEFQTLTVTEQYAAWNRPRWSPDGRYLLWNEAENQGDSAAAFNLFDLQTGVNRPLVDRPIQMSTASWSPDGRYVTFMDASTEQAARPLSIVDIQTGEHWQLGAIQPNLRENPRTVWSPGSQRFASVQRTRHGSDIFLMSPDSGEAQQLTSEFGVDSTRPHWSPDGRYIAYMRYANSRSYVQLIDMQSGERRPLAGGLFFNLAWSADSRHLALTDSSAVYVVEVASGNLHMIQQGFTFRGEPVSEIQWVNWQ